MENSLAAVEIYFRDRRQMTLLMKKDEAWKFYNNVKLYPEDLRNPGHQFYELSYLETVSKGEAAWTTALINIETIRYMHIPLT